MDRYTSVFALLAAAAGAAGYLRWRARRLLRPGAWKPRANAAVDVELLVIQMPEAVPLCLALLDRLDAQIHWIDSVDGTTTIQALTDGDGRRSNVTAVQLVVSPCPGGSRVSVSAWSPMNLWDFGVRDEVVHQICRGLHASHA